MLEHPPASETKRYLPIITTLHGTDITLVGLDPSYLPITRFGIEQSDGVTAISEHLRERTLAAFSTSNLIEVIRNFVNCDVYVRHPQIYARMRPTYAAADEHLLVHLSNFRPVKRVGDVVEVFARVARELPARLMMIGDGPDRSLAEHLARQYRVQDRVHFLGKQDNVNELLPLADLMLMPSEMESFGLAALEAMASSVPAIATRVGGVPELIRDRENGRLFPVGEVDAMAAAAVDLLQHPEQLATMAGNARKTAQDFFCASRIIPLYEQYYEQVLARPHRSL